MLNLRKRLMSVILVLGSCFLMVVGITGCESAISDTSLKFSFSDFNGIKTKDICLNSDVNKLNISGRIALKSGKVRLFIKVKATGKELYSHEYTANGAVDININDVGSDKDLLFGLDATHAKGVDLDLTSRQKLIRDPEVPAIPSVSKPSKPGV